MEAKEFLPHYTYDDYVNWEGRWELLQGIPHAMSPMPAPKHQRIAAMLKAEFIFALRDCQTCSVYDPIDYKIKEDTIVQPDALIVCGAIEKPFLDFPPELVVEVLSPSTASKDRLFKFNLYQQQRVPYYLILDPVAEEVEVYALQEETYQLQQQGHAFRLSFTFDGNCKADIDFEKIW